MKICFAIFVIIFGFSSILAENQEGPRAKPKASAEENQRAAARTAELALRNPNCRVLLVQTNEALNLATDRLQAELGSQFIYFLTTLKMNRLFVLDTLYPAAAVTARIVYIGSTSGILMTDGEPEELHRASLFPFLLPGQPSVWLVFVVPGNIEEPVLINQVPISEKIAAEYKLKDTQQLFAELGVQSLRSGVNWFNVANPVSVFVAQPVSAFGVTIAPKPMPGIAGTEQIETKPTGQLDKYLLDIVLPKSALADLRLVLKGKADPKKLKNMKGQMVSEFGKTLAGLLEKEPKP